MVLGGGGRRCVDGCCSGDFHQIINRVMKMSRGGRFKKTHTSTWSWRRLIHLLFYIYKNLQEHIPD